jgi:hypothetical protein
VSRSCGGVAADDFRTDSTLLAKNVAKSSAEQDFSSLLLLAFSPMMSDIVFYRF